MEKTFLKFAAVFFVGLVLTTSGCKDDPSAEEIFMAKISKHWTATNVTLDDVPVNGAFDGFAITIVKDKTFITENGNAPIWPAASAFTLKKGSATTGFDLLRSDGVEVEVAELTDEKLVLTFRYISTGGRSSSVTGDYIFELSN
jgi:hypothetical protein